jgi:hypothetical protein
MNTRIRFLAAIAVCAAGLVLIRVPVATQTVRRPFTPDQRARRAARRANAPLRSRQLYQSQHPGVSVVDEIPLDAEPGSDDLFDGVRLVRFSDGAYRVEISKDRFVLSSATPQPLSYIVANLAERTYHTFHWQALTPTPAELDRVRQYARQHPQIAFRADRDLDPWAKIDVTQAYAERAAQQGSRFRRRGPDVASVKVVPAVARMQDPGCWGYYSATLWSIDPAFLKVNATTIEVDFSEDYDYNWYPGGSAGGWANPSVNALLFTTHWFIDYDYPYVDYWDNWGTAWAQDDAEYECDDFPPSGYRPVNVYSGGHFDYEYGWLGGGMYWGLGGNWTGSYLTSIYQPSGADYCYYGF